MENKIGEIITLGNKKYKVTLTNNDSNCISCDLNNSDYCYYVGHCSRGYRNDNKSIIYKEIKDMEDKKEVKISIPEGYEIDKEKSSFEKIIFKKKENNKTWDDLIDTTIPQGSSYIERMSPTFLGKVIGNFSKYDKHIFIDRKHAKSALAMAQISQLMSFYGGPITDEEWEDVSIPKYTLCRRNNKVATDTSYLWFNFLAFHTKEQRASFHENNKQLVEDYVMI